jgi:hypothetical protein
MLALQLSSYTVLTQPNTSTAVSRAGVKIGTVTCINTARPSEPVALRYYGQNASGTASGQAHPTQAQAVANVEAWADGREVTYPKQAEVPACNGQCGICNNECGELATTSPAAQVKGVQQ